MEQQTQPKVFDKSRLKEEDQKFTALPQNIHHYIYHPEMKAEMVFLYGIIVDFYNVEEGYAFPALTTLEMRYGKHRDTVSKHLFTLRKLGLIDFPVKEVKGKEHIADAAYVPLVPLDQSDFFTQSPEAFEMYQQSIKKRDEQRESGKKRINNWRSKFA